MSNYEGAFDKALKIIDSNIKLRYSEIERKLYAETGYCTQDYNKFMAITTSGKLSLKKYYNQRRAYYAACELKKNTEKSICEISEEFNYFDQAALSNAIRKEFKTTPSAIRKGNILIPDNRFNTSNIVNTTNRLFAVIEKLKKDVRYDINNPIGKESHINDTYKRVILKWDRTLVNDTNYFETFINATDEYGFDIETCCLISDLSEKLRLPFSFLMNNIFNYIIAYSQAEDYLPEQIEYLIDLGIHSDIEKKTICDYYNCEYYELTPKMVLEYKEKFEVNTDCEE